MYRALYNFASKDVGTLSFQTGDKFTLIDCSIDENWWHVVDVHGQAGYVPVQYLEKDQVLAQDDVVKSIDRAIEFIHLAATNSGGILNAEQRRSLQKLVEHRKNVIEGTDLASQQPKRRAPSLQEAKQTPSSKRSSTKSRSAPPPPERTTPETTPVAKTFFQPSVETAGNVPAIESTPKADTSHTKETSVANLNSNTSEIVNLKTVDVPHGMLPEIVEQVRNRTGLSFDKSKLAVKVVLSQIAGNIPELATAMETILESSSTEEEESTTVVLEGGKDYERLEVIFSELVSCKDDSQQRSWALHEDEAIITEYLEELQTILVDADARVCKAVIQKNSYDYLSSLVLYYQMEHRLTIRLLLLRVFGGICGLDLKAISHLLGTILPVELARDLKTDKENYVKMCYSSLLCVMLFSTGEQVPITHYDHLNAEFVSFVLDFIEDPPYDEEAEQNPDIFVNLLLSFNLHFQDPASNTLMSVLATGRPCKSFSEKIMLLVNRGVDPVKILDHVTDAPDSLIKFLLDVFSSQTTSEIFYTNDMKVLIGIIVRQLTDLSPGNQIRTENLSLLFKIFENSSYWEHCHRLSELVAVFDRILGEEGSASEEDKAIVTRMKTKFGQQLSLNS